MSQDLLQSFLFPKSSVRGVIVTLESSLQQLFAGQKYGKAQQCLLSEFSATCLVITSHTKLDGRISLQARAKGEAGLVLAECTGVLDFRGVINSPDGTPQSFADIREGGLLAVTVLPREGNSYQGIVPMEKQSLAGCMEDYFLRSEQIPTCFLIFATSERVTALMLQLMPGHPDSGNPPQEEDWERIFLLARSLTPDEALTLSHQEILYRLFHEENPRVFEPRPVHYRCSCSRERMTRNLLSLGNDELVAIAQEEEATTLECHFCHTTYLFSRDEILLLLENGQPGTGVVH